MGKRERRPGWGTVQFIGGYAFVFIAGPFFAFAVEGRDDATGYAIAFVVTIAFALYWLGRAAWNFTETNNSAGKVFAGIMVLPVLWVALNGVGHMLVDPVDNEAGSERTDYLRWRVCNYTDDDIIGEVHFFRSGQNNPYRSIDYELGSRGFTANCTSWQRTTCHSATDGVGAHAMSLNMAAMDNWPQRCDGSSLRFEMRGQGDIRLR